MADPILNADVAAAGLKSLLWQFRDQPNIDAILSSYLVQDQDLEDMFFDLLILRRLAAAEGEQLDGFGSIVGELRLGRDDTDYRAAIFGRIQRNQGDAKTEDIILLFVLMLGPTFPIQVSDGTLASFLVTINAALGGIDVPSAITLAGQLARAKGGGVRATLVFAEVDPDETFTYASGDVIEIDSSRGYSDDAGTTGGRYADALLAER